MKIKFQFDGSLSEREKSLAREKVEGAIRDKKFSCEHCNTAFAVVSAKDPLNVQGKAIISCNCKENILELHFNF